MAKHGSNKVWLLVDGYDMAVNKHTGARYKITSAMEPGHGIGDSWEEQIASGLQKAEIAVESGFFNTSTSGGFLHCIYSTTLPDDPGDTARIVCMGFAGYTSGQMFVGVEGTYAQDYEIIGQIGNVTRANVTYAASGRLDQGRIIHPLAAETGATDTDAMSVDFGTESTGGGYAYLQVTSLTLDVSTGATVTIRDSTDNITFADVASFSSVAAVGAERIAVTSGAVGPYVSESVTFSATSGSPSITYMVGFARI